MRINSKSAFAAAFVTLASPACFAAIAPLGSKPTEIPAPALVCTPQADGSMEAASLTPTGMEVVKTVTVGNPESFKGKSITVVNADKSMETTNVSSEDLNLTGQDDDSRARQLAAELGKMDQMSCKKSLSTNKLN